MILVDANLLIYAYARDLPEHDAAHAWLEGCLNSGDKVGLPWPSLLAFARLVSNPRIFERPVAVSDAWRQVEEWLELPSVWIPVPTDRHQSVLTPMVGETGGRSNLIPDAHLAALAVEYGLTLCSTDGDFARFSELRWVNPLVS